MKPTQGEKTLEAEDVVVLETPHLQRNHMSGHDSFLELDEVAKELCQLDGDSPVWEKFPRFVEQVQSIAGDRCQKLMRDLSELKDRARALKEKLDQYATVLPNFPRALDADAQPSPEPESTSLGQGPASDSPDSVREQNLSPSIAVPQEAPSPTEEEIKPEPGPQPEKRELLSVRDRARQLEKDDSDDIFYLLISDLVSTGDLAAACLLVRGQEAPGSSKPLDLRDTGPGQLLRLTKMLRLLVNRSETPALNKLVDAILSLTTLSGTDYPLKVRYLQRGGETIQEIGEKAREFLKYYEGHKFQSALNGGEATQALKILGSLLMEPDGPLHRLLTPVIKNNVGKISQVRQELERLKDDRHRGQLIDRIAKNQQLPVPERKISDTLTKIVFSAFKLARSWYYRATLHQVKEILPEVEAELHRMQQAPLQEQVALIHLIQKIVGAIKDKLCLAKQANFEAPEARLEHGSNSIEETEACRLLRVPGIFFEEDGYRPKSSMADINKYLRRSLAEDQSLSTAFIRRMEEGQDFRFADLVRRYLLSKDAEELNRFNEQYDEKLRNRRAMAKTALKELKDEIEKSLEDGSITSAEYAFFKADMTSVEGVLHFAPLSHRLNDLRNKLDDKTRIAELRRSGYNV